MKLKTDEFKDCIKTILQAIDTKEPSMFTETLELITSGSNLFLNVTNREYYVSVKFKLENEEKFHASVNARVFLNLISQVTTDYIEMSLENNNIKIIANGEYKLPIIYNGASMLVLPKIEVNNITNEMSINSDILLSILNYNSKELQVGTPVKPVQKYYYIDEHGAITFTSGACINNFELEKPIKILLNDKVVKLFKLFKDTDKVEFKMGQEDLGNGLIQTRVQFKSDNIDLSAKLQDSSLVSSVPVAAIRTMGTKTYPYSILISKDSIIQAINRLSLFNDGGLYGFFEFTSDNVTIYNYNKDSKEVIKLENKLDNFEYKFILDLNNLKLILDTCQEDYLTITFGDTRAVVINRNNIINIIPELKIS